MNDQMPNGVYKHKPFDDDLIIHRTFVDPPTNDKTTEEPEKGELEKLKPVPFHKLVRKNKHLNFHLGKKDKHFLTFIK
jgi:hypothetical protein